MNRASILTAAILGAVMAGQFSQAQSQAQTEEQSRGRPNPSEEFDKPVPPGASPTRLIGGKSADTHAISELSDDWVLCFKAGDIEALVKLYAKDAVIMSPGKPRVVGAEAIRAALLPLLHAPDRSIVTHIEEIGVDGRHGWASVLAVIGYRQADGSRREYVSRTFLLYQRSGRGEWKIYRDVDQPTPDADALKVH